ncbi:outer membrane beta-barrel protein [Alteromonas sp. A081]|uniref:outer membrane beta-barrel protein n=1 Tax=Alteromonas sp. A081 TaxID=3410269 RepID=UPI003B981533
MSTWTKNIIVLSAVCAAAPINVNAQEAGRIEVGQFDFVPILNSSISYVDNVSRVSDDDPKIFSWRSVISPEVIAATEINGNPVQLGYRLERGVYFSSSNDDYTDHFLEASTEIDINSRNRFNILAQYEDGHEDRGSGFSIGFGQDLTTPDTYKSSLVGVNYKFGSITSNAGLAFRANRSTLEYDRTEDQYLIRNRAVNVVGAEFNYDISPSVSLVLDLTRSSINYDEQLLLDPLDSDETRLLVGVRWENTAATTGYAKVGYKEKEFDAQARDTFYGTDWEVGVEWQPLTYSTFDFSTSATTNETNGEGSLIRSRLYRASWNHNWLERLSTSFGVVIIDDEYILDGAVLANRTDDVTRYNAALNYNAQRWLSFSLFYNINKRDSNREIIGYDQRVLGVSAEVTL